MLPFPTFPKLPEFTITRLPYVAPVIRVRPHTDDMSQMLDDTGVDPAYWYGADLRRRIYEIAADVSARIDITSMFVMSGRR